MKHLLFYIFFLFTSIIYSQEDSISNEELSKFEFSYSYGISYLEYADFNSEDPLGFQVSPFGSFQELNFDFRLPKNRFIGLGVSSQQHSKMIDKNLSSENSLTILISDYKNSLQSNYIDIHFRQVFKSGFQLTFGIYYINQVENYLRVGVFEDSTDIFLSSDTINDAGLFISPEYFLGVNKYLDVGIKAKAYYTFGIFEAITLLPTARLKL